MPETQIAIGTVRTAWGLKGWLKLSSYSGEWDHFTALETVTLKSRGSNRLRVYQVEGFRVHDESGQIKLAGVDSPEAGKALAGSEILVSRDHAASLGEDEWYIADLVGLRLTDAGGEVLGEVISVVESADDILEVRKPGGGIFMVPFRSEFVGVPDLNSKTLVLTALWVMDES